MAEWLIQNGAWLSWIPGVLAAIFAVWKARDIERLKHELTSERERLKHELSSEREQLKATLEIANYERKTQFAAVNERRVEVLQNLYRRIVRAEWALREATHPIQLGSSQEALDAEQQERERKAVDAGTKLNRYFYENEVWLSEPLEQLVEGLLVTNVSNWNKFRYREAPHAHSEWSEAWESFREQVPHMRDEIRAEMRATLGASDVRRPAP